MRVSRPRSDVISEIRLWRFILARVDGRLTTSPPLGRRQVSVLGLLWASEGLKQKLNQVEIAYVINSTKEVISQVLARLHELGLYRQVKGLYQITPDGKQALDDWDEWMRGKRDSRETHLTPKEQRQVTRFYRKDVEAIRAQVRKEIAEKRTQRR